MTNMKQFAWPKTKKAALSLTFDDARASQLQAALPILNRYNVKATFYVVPDPVEKNLQGWREVVQAGHEIGNHTVTHPCSGNYEFSRHNAIEDYTMQRIEAEISGATKRIEDLLNVTPRTFAYPCGEKFVGRGENCQSYVPLVARQFLAGRGAGSQSENAPAACDLSQLLAGGMDNQAYEPLRKLIERSSEQNGWLILVGHEAGERGVQRVDVEALDHICRFAADPANGLWIDTVANVAGFIRRANC